MSAMTGRVIAGRYRLAEPIGRGAMGVVWHAKDQLLDREVAIKEVRFNEALGEVERANAYKRTLREARTAARLSHRGVVTVFDVAEADGRPWIVMELIRARSLDEVLASDGPQPPGRVARIAQQLLSALAHAHSSGVLHRDVKPSNVLIATGGFDERAVLTDFGIAQFEGDPRLTQTGMVMGSPGFTAPERIRGGDATPASDLWSLGATIYAACEGRGPYEQRGGAITTMTAIINEDAPVAPSADRLAPVIAALLRRDPKRRPTAPAAANMITEVLPLLPDARGGRGGTVVSPSSAAAKRRSPLARAVPPPAPAPSAPAPAPVAPTGVDAPPEPKPAAAAQDEAAPAADAPATAGPGGAEASAAGAAGISDGASQAPAPEAASASAADVEEAPDAALDEAIPADSVPAGDAAASKAAVSNAGAGKAAKPAPGSEPAVRDIPAAGAPAPDKAGAVRAGALQASPVKASAAKAEAGKAEAGKADAGKAGVTAAADDTDQYAKTLLTSSGAILAAAEAKSAGNAGGSTAAADAPAHELTVKASAAMASAAAPSGDATAEPTVKVTRAPVTPSATVKAATPAAPKPVPSQAAAPKPVPPQQPEKEAWWSSAYQTQGPPKGRPAVGYPPAQPGPASAFSQPAQYSPPAHSGNPATTPQPYSYDPSYPPGTAGPGQPNRKGGAGKKIGFTLLAMAVVAAVVVVAILIGKHSGSTPGTGSSAVASTGAAGSAGSGPAAPTANVPTVTHDTPTVIRAIDDHSDAMPAGFTPYTLRPSAAGTVAGFTIDVPPGWTVDQQTPKRIFFKAPDGISNVEVDLTRHSRSDMVGEARSIKQQTIAAGKFPGYQEKQLGPENVLGTRGALWRFDWTNNSNGTQMRVDDMLFILPTPNGAQSYAIYMTAPDGTGSGTWNASILPLVAKMLRSFSPAMS